jgi:hypothetical protein
VADHCPFVESCRLYPVFRLQASLRTWQIRYCEADYECCERHRRAKLGLPVPLQLLPNGKSLPTSAKKEP